MATKGTVRPQIIGRAPQLLAELNQIERVASDKEIVVLILGETGTGKELAAQLVHEKSGRTGPFIAFNCGTGSKELLDSTLFGYVRGSFTGAHRDHLGLFEQAHGGTLFLDEVGEMSPEMQVRVLRAIQDSVITRIGDTQTRRIDVRLVTATHRNLRSMVDNGQFREDLYYRLKGCSVTLPPLRDRGRDVLRLARAFMREKFPNKRIGQDAEVALLSYPWPGNIRELQSVVRLASRTSGRTIHCRHLGDICLNIIDGTNRSRSEITLHSIDRLTNGTPLEIHIETSLNSSSVLLTINDLVAAGVLARIGDERDLRYTLGSAPAVLRLLGALSAHGNPS